MPVQIQTGPRPNLGRVRPQSDQGFVIYHTAGGAAVYSDDASAYESLPFDHETIKHPLAEYVRGDVHTYGIESLWATMKRAHKGTFHKISLRETGYEDWVSADPWSYYGYQYLDLDAPYDIRFRVGDYTRWWLNAGPRPDCSVGPIR